MSFQLVSTVTVGAGGASSISFTGIPQTGTDLLLVLSARSDAALVQTPVLLTVNADNTTTYQNRGLRGGGSSTDSTNTPTNLGIFLNSISAASATSNTFSNGSVYITNYSGSASKTFSTDNVFENNATEAQQAIFAGLWPQTAAITTLRLNPLSGNFAQNTTASLYLITKA